MAEYRLDLVGDTENLTNALTEVSNTLQELGDEAIDTSKKTKAAFNDTGGVEKLDKSLKSQVLTLARLETEMKKIIAAKKTAFDGKEAAALDTQLKSVAGSLQKLDSEITAVSDSNKSLKAQLRENKEILAQMEEQGLETTQTFFELSVQTGKLQDQISDTNERIKFFASDTKALDGLIGVTKTLTAGFAVGQGAAALFGAENENVQKALLKVNAAMAILNGLQEIQAALQKSSAARITVETALRKIKTFVIGEEAVATNTLTAAQAAAATGAKVLRAALLATGVGAVLFLVTSLVSAISAMNDFESETDDATKALKRQDEALQDLEKTFERTSKQRIADAKRLGAAGESLRLIEIEEQKKLKEIYQKDADDRFRIKEQAIKDLQAVTKDGDADELKKAQSNLDAANKSYRDAQDKVLDIQAEIKRLKTENETETNAEFAESNKKFDEDEKQRREKKKADTKRDAEIAKTESERLLKEQQDFLKMQNDFLNANMTNQFDNEKAVNDKIIQNNLEFLKDLENIKQLELDIEFETGTKSIAETQRIAEEKLKTEIEFAKKRLEILKSLGGDEAQIKAIELAIAKGQNTLDQLAKEGNPSKFLEAIGLGGISGEDLGKLIEGLNVVASSIKSILGDALASAIDSNRNYIDGLTDQIETVRSNIEKQSKLQEEGQANNLENEERNLEQLEAARLAAFERDKKLQKQKLTLDAASQVSSLLTASASIFKELAPIAPPIGIALAIAAITSMFGAFAFTQVRARQAINAQTLKEGGIIRGKRHNVDGWGGERFVSDSGNETYIEDGEYVVNRKSTQKYKDLIDAINKDRLGSMDINHLLRHTGVSLSKEAIEGYKTRLGTQERNRQIEVIKLGNEYNPDIKGLREDFNKFVEQRKQEETEKIENGYLIRKKGNRTTKTKL